MWYESKQLHATPDQPFGGHEKDISFNFLSQYVGSFNITCVMCYINHFETTSFVFNL